MAYDLSFDYAPIQHFSKNWPESIQNNIRRAPPYRLFRFKPLDKLVLVLEYHFDSSISLYASQRVNTNLDADDLVVPDEYGFTLENDYDGDLIIRHAFIDQLEDYHIPEQNLESFGTAWTNYAH